MLCALGGFWGKHNFHIYAALLPPPLPSGVQKPQNFPLFFFFAGGRDFEKNERKILRILKPR